MGTTIIEIAVGLAAVIAVYATLRLTRRHVAPLDHTRAWEAIPAAVLLVDADGDIVYANENSMHTLGYSTEELYGMKVEDLMPARFRGGHEHMRQHFMTNPSDRPMGQGRDLFVLTKTGKELPVEISLGTEMLSDEEPLVIAIISDISERRKAERLVEHMAYFDSLTNLPNRDSFVSFAKDALIRARDMHMELVILLVDINRFRRINDTLGHHVGDLILQDVAIYLQTVVDTKCEDEEKCGCFVARLGGDEFAMVLERTGEGVAEKIADRIIERFEQPISADGYDTEVSISMGAAIFPNDGITFEQLLKGADLALSHAKREGQKRMFLHDQEMTTQIDRFVEYENIIRHFIANDDFILNYQPVVDTHTGSVVGAEALFRSNPEIFDSVNLGLLIDVAEETGLIVDLGRAIFKRACLQCADCCTVTNQCVVSINVSVRQLEHPDFVEQYLGIINDVGIDPYKVAIEVTETMVITNGRDVIDKLQQMRDAGVRVFIDDFGKGYSSMTYLRRLPADKLKIDMAFVRNVVKDPTDAEIFNAINNVAQTLGLVTCAEGVETEEQMMMMRKFGVDHIQGYYTGKPMPHEEMKTFIEERS